jgi:hypothetical protein
MGFLNPTAFLFAALYGVLVVLYLWQRRQRHIDVPSLLLWAKVPEDVARTSRFLPDLLFVLQLLLLTLLIGGLAHPYVRGVAAERPPTRSIFVLDLSASMQAREGRQTRFEEARTALIRRVQGLRREDESMLITAAAHPSVAVPVTRDHDALVGRLQQLRPTDTAADFDLALALAHRAAARGDLTTYISAFTDLPPSDLDPAWRGGVDFVQVGETDDNVAILALDLNQEPFEDLRRAHAEVVVRNFAHRDAHGVLTMRLAGQVLSRQGFSLPSRDARTFFVRGFEQPGILEAVLEGDDALAADNRALAWLAPERRLRVLAVTGPTTLHAQLEAIAGATTSLQFRFLAPEQYRPEAALEADVVLFHRFVPEAEPPRARLYLHPPGDNRLFPGNGHLSDVALLNWDEKHSVLRTLPPLAPFPFARVQRLTAPAWVDVLLSGRAGEIEVPLAFAGERDGHRTACVAFDLAREQMLRADKVGLLLFFLNLLDWLAPKDESTLVVRTGTIQTLQGLPLVPRRVTDPHGLATDLPAEPTLSIEPLFAGEYEIAFNGTRRRLLANLFDAAESDIGRPAHEAGRQIKPATRGAPAAAGGHFALWLYVAALVLFLFEWLVALRRA